MRTRQIGAPEPVLAGPPEHVHTVDLAADRFGQIGRAVRAVVVDDEHVGGRHDRVHLPQSLLDGGGLV